MIGRVVAYLRGDAPAQVMSRYGRDGSDAYDLVDTLPPGPARSAAWNAYVCQTYADKLCSAGGVAPQTAPMIRALYAQVGPWLERARDGSAGGDLVLPQWRTGIRSQRELAGMRATLEALRTHVAFDLGASRRSTRCGSRGRRPTSGSESETPSRAGSPKPARSEERSRSVKGSL